jgi:hypothetical protein
MTATYLTHAAELVVTTGEFPGPTGEFVEVLRDAAGNVLFAGDADGCVAELKSYVSGVRSALRLRPTEWRRVAGEVAGADYTWGYAS